MMHQTYYDYQLKPIIKAAEKTDMPASLKVRFDPEVTESNWMHISAEQLKAILHILNTTI